MESTENFKKNNLWNKNFFLLWQGQLVSCLGDAFYSMALGFWVLDKTGSSAIMGMLMAAVSIPRIIIGPFAGVIVDRFDRKKLILLGDFIRGIGMVFVGYAAFNNFLEVWMVMIVGIVCGICSAFFNPAISSVIPDLVSSDNIVKANSAQQMATSTTHLIGSVSGGFIYSILGASVMFIFNGISYIVSTISEIFIDIPKVERKNTELTIKEDFKEGIKFTFGFRGFVILLFVAFSLNFLYAMFFLLLRPLFMMEESLGVARFGIISAFQSIGMISASIILTKVNIKAENRSKVMLPALFSQSLFFFLGILINNFYFMCLCFSLGSFLNTISNTVSTSSMMVVIPQDMRGKVMSIVFTLSMGIHPIGTLVGGILGDIFYPRTIMIGCFLIGIIVSIPILFSKSVKNVLNYNPKNQTLEEIKN
ncbi:MAG: MFS transporter [Paraclostridium sp.]|uniref:MFS transporter n=1 Tax=Paraclostridium sp. TaxID=2023273 RepID=UPI003F2FD449